MTEQLENVGTLSSIRRHPVKSMRGEDLESAVVLTTGVEGDRVYAFIEQGKAKVKPNFPWFTARELPSMALLKPEFQDDGLYIVIVTLPDGRRFPVTDRRLKDYLETAGLRQSQQPRSLELKFSPQGNYDSHPISLFGMQTVQKIEEEAGIVDLDHRRFRANFYVSWQNNTPFFENDLVSRVLQIGDNVRIRLDEKDTRCAMINIDPSTGRVTPSVLRVVAQKHGNCAGVYASVLQEGAVMVKDPVYLLS